MTASFSVGILRAISLPMFKCAFSISLGTRRSHWFRDTSWNSSVAKVSRKTRSSSSAQNLLADVQSDMEKVRRSKLGGIPDPFTACAPSSYLAWSAVQQKIWQLLNRSPQKSRTFGTIPSTLRLRSALQCNLCDSGWVGTLTFKKTVSDDIVITSSTQTKYTWDETQTWTIGGVPVGTTQYPATFTATGGGNKEVAAGQQGRITWTANVTAPGTLTVFGTQQAPASGPLPSDSLNRSSALPMAMKPTRSRSSSRPGFSISHPTPTPTAAQLLLRVSLDTPATQHKSLAPPPVRSTAPGPLPSNKTSSSTFAVPLTRGHSAHRRL
jgi:hypothetical protein